MNAVLEEKVKNLSDASWNLEQTLQAYSMGLATEGQMKAAERMVQEANEDLTALVDRPAIWRKTAAEVRAAQKNGYYQRILGGGK